MSKFNDKTIVSLEDQINFLKDQVTDLLRYCNLMKRTIKKLENNNAKLLQEKKKLQKQVLNLSEFLWTPFSD